MVLRRRLSGRERKALYQGYLKTDHWRQRRELALERAERRCQECGKGGPLEVHHLTYARLFQERDEDLLVLCRDCPRQTARLQRRRRYAGFRCCDAGSYI